jgi:NAD(P)-dependent dehydrogenase (short-subunit alcohol dehydrogenase family)
VSGAFESGHWAVILGGSSGFGLATAHKLAQHGMNLCIVHRDRRSQLSRIEPEFEKIRGSGARLLTFNKDALNAAKRAEIAEELASALGEGGRVRVLLHSIAFGNLKLLVPEVPRARTVVRELAEKLGVDEGRVQRAADELFEADVDHAQGHFARTIFNMGTSLLSWVEELFGRKLFADDARVFGLTSEGNEVAWKGYAAVSAAKVALEALARSIAVEFAPYGIRCNVIQPGIAETPALAAIPGSDQLKAQARLRNPFGRLTTPADVANVIYLLSTDEAAWINGAIIRVDGGERISGAIG